MEDKVAKLLFSNNTSYPIGALRIITQLARSITEINGYFATTAISSVPSIVNIYSETSDPVLQVSRRTLSDPHYPLRIFEHGVYIKVPYGLLICADIRQAHGNFRHSIRATGCLQRVA